jgi:hypothetical protein
MRGFLVAGAGDGSSRRARCRSLSIVGVAALAVLIASTTGAAAADGTPKGVATSGQPAAEFTLAPDRGLVGGFGGFGGQFNQHLYAKISGPPPNLPNLETKVVALHPQFVRIFFNTTEWTYADRMASFLRTVELAERAGAEINVTWQGSTFAFAMQNMPRFADVIARVLGDTPLDHIWVTLFNEPNTTSRTLSEYEQVYRSLDGNLRERGVRDRVHFMGGDLTRSTTGPSQAEWFQYMASHMGDLLDAWSVHVYWDFWDSPKIDQRLRSEVRAIFAAIPAPQRRPLYVTEFGIRGVATFEGELSFDPGYWPDGTPMAATNAAAFQQAWFMIRAAQLGFTATVKWDVYPAKYDAGTQDHSAIGPAADGWPARPLYNLLQLFTLTTNPRGGRIVDMVPTAATDPSKLVTSYISPAGDITILGLDSEGGPIETTSHAPVSYSIGGLPPNTMFRLFVWNADGTGTNKDAGFFDTGTDGVLQLSVPLDAAFALTNTPIMSVPW